MLLPTPRSSPSPLQCFDATPVRRGFPPFSTVFHRFPPFSPIFSPLPRSPLPRDVTPRPDITFPCSSRPVAALPEGAERRLSGTSGTSGEGSHELDTIQDRAAQETDCTQDTMSKSAVKISSDLLSNPLCEQEPSFLEMVTAFDTAMKRMDSFNQEKVNQIQKTVIEPLKKFSSVFPSLNMAVKRREQTLQDYKRLQSKVEKYEEKERTGPVLAKLHQAREELRPVREDFEAKNKQLLEEMPKFYSSRIDYFKPSFEALVRAQVVYYTEMHKIFGELTAQIDQPGLSDEQRERDNDAKLSELRALSIVADD
ncbi:bridging integrator 3 isoform X3 [Lathamus discolor]|uniref:bridging integrator 3 isoform X3 n=1 Tax=Lathamus discolor TaxID=678569 RepID=UPI0032B77BB9